jgi:type IV pilus assembly protein PilB
MSMQDSLYKDSKQQSAANDILKDENSFSENDMKSDKRKVSTSQISADNFSESINWQDIEVDEKILELISVDSLSKFRFVPFEMVDKFIKVAVVDEANMNTQNALRFFSRKTKKRLEIYSIGIDDFNVLVGKIKNKFLGIESALDVYEQKEEESAVKDGMKLRKRKENVRILKDAPISQMVESIIENAIDSGVSDIHIEAMAKNVRVRYRIDGDLKTVITLPKKIASALVSRVKILSNLKIDEKRKPQDGRFRIDDLGKTIDFRVSSFPTAYGEKVVMRILDTNAGLMKLNKLGIQGRDREIVEKTIIEPYGIVLITGPTGSGKSTTLYSMLRLINREEVNIITLEDPIEYVLEGVNQSQMRPEIGYTFASGLRSVLRQDPDILMVGEIRDEETAELAIHASLTGHLVLSTLHTNSAAGAIPRLIDMHVQPFLLASSLKLVMAQRLVRGICQDCKKPIDDLNIDMQHDIKRELQLVDAMVLKSRGIEIDVSDPDSKIIIYKGEGCSKCQGNGMKGRIGIFEVIEVTKNLSKLISKGALGIELEDEARKDGFTTMKQDGLIKVLTGLTTLEEIQRVTEEDVDEIYEEEIVQNKGSVTTERDDDNRDVDVETGIGEKEPIEIGSLPV